MEITFDGKQFANQLSTRDANRVGEALSSLSQASKIIYSRSDGHQLEQLMVKELKTHGGLDRIFELIAGERGIIQDYCITVLSGLTISNNDVGIATNQNRQVIQELLNKVKQFNRGSATTVLGLIQNLSYHYQTFRIRMAYEIGVLERILRVLEEEVPKPIVPLDANNYIYNGTASPRFSLFTILSNISVEKSLRLRLYELGLIPLCIEMLRKPIEPPSFPGEPDNGEGAALEIVAQIAEMPQLRHSMLQKYGNVRNVIPQSFSEHPNQKTREWYHLACNLLVNPLHQCSNTFQNQQCSRKETSEGTFRACPCHQAWYCSDQCQRSHWTAHAKECKAIDPDRIESVRKRKEEGNTLFARGEFEGAIRVFSQALQSCDRQEDNPLDCATLLVNRAASFFKLKDYQSAVNDCNRALQLSPDYAKAYVWRGQSHQGLGYFKLALDDLCVGYSMVENHLKKEIRDVQLYCCEKLLGTKIRVVPVHKDKKQAAFNIINIPQDTDTLDSAIRIVRKQDTPLRKRLADARRYWEHGVQLCEAKDFVNATVKLGDALAIDERLLPIDIMIINSCLQNIRQLGLESLLLSAFMAIQTGRIGDADNILTQSIDSLRRPTSDRELLYLSRFFALRAASRCMLGNKKGGMEDLDQLASINPHDCEHLYAKAKIIQGKIDPNAMLLPHFIQVENLLAEYLSRADMEEKRVPFVFYNLSYLYCIKRDMQRAKEYFRKAVDSEKISSVLWGCELDIENDPARKMAFLMLKNDLDARESKS